MKFLLNLKKVVKILNKTEKYCNKTEKYRKNTTKDNPKNLAKEGEYETEC